MKKHNFSAGPCILPKEVLKQASEAVINFNNDNLSVLEISHRSHPFSNVMDKAQNLVKELLEIPEGYSVLFLQGGASLEFWIPVQVERLLCCQRSGHSRQEFRGRFFHPSEWSANPERFPRWNFLHCRRE